MKSVLLLLVCLVAFAQCQIPMGEYPTKVTAFVRNAANFAADTLNSLSNSLYWEVLTGIHNATVEAVIGLMYRMDITVKQSTCKNLPAHNDASPTTCPPQNGATAKYCHVEVLDDSSNNPRYSLKNYTCHF